MSPLGVDRRENGLVIGVMHAAADYLQKVRKTKTKSLEMVKIIGTKLPSPEKRYSMSSKSIFTHEAGGTIQAVLCRLEHCR
jgi:hypothetical protein